MVKSPLQQLRQPSLLDKLTDDDAEKLYASRDKFFLSTQKLKKSVLRDLNWLLNTTGLSALQDLKFFPLAANSVINFGFPNLAGKTVSSINLAEIEQLMRETLVKFEPRISSETLEVQIIPAHQIQLDQHSQGGPNCLVLEVRGVLWGQSRPEAFYLEAKLDLEVGTVKISNFN
jgi:type VI secretion system protein ImpF